MRIVRTQLETREAAQAQRAAGHSIGLVPTMGALHEGHLGLIRAARRSNDFVVVSVFVNPLQFGPSEDFAAYPRSEDEDLRMLEREGVDLVFAPSRGEMYPDESSARVVVGGLGEVLEGAARPGHFGGVATVVTKLFNLTEPRRAYFGQKDAQQVAVVKRLVLDLSFGVEVCVCPTVRGPDGLAMSSRNVGLSARERRRATVLWRALEAGERAIRSDEDPEAAMLSVFAAEPEVELGYARALDPDTFDAPAGPRVLLVVAARVGKTRLIDNLIAERR